jgi:protein O-GlcNAc transferase
VILELVRANMIISEKITITDLAAIMRAKGILGILVSLGICLSLAGCNTGSGGGIPGLPSLGQSPVQKASELYLQGKYVDAEVEADKAVKDRKDYGFACTILAEALSAQGKFADAEIQAREGVRHEPRVANSHIALARALNGLGTWVEAEAEARQAIQLPESNSTPTSRAAQHTVLGSALQMQLKLPDAEQEYRAAIQADPNFGPAYLAYGMLLNALTKFKEAEPMLEKAVQLEPNNAIPYTPLIVCLTNMNRLDEAAKFTERLMALTPKDPNVLVMQANIYYKKGDFPSAENECRKAIKLNPMFGPSYTTLAASLDKQNRLNEAEAAGIKATQLSPVDPLAYLALAQTLANERKWVASGFACATAGSLAPMNKPFQAEVQKLGARIWANIPKPKKR